MSNPINVSSLPWSPHALPKLAGRVYAVTGASSGIGYFAAEQLAAAGAEIVLASRSSARLEVAASTLRSRVAGARTHVLEVDLASLTSVAEAGAALASLPRLDGLLLNGGPMTFDRAARTVDGLPSILGAHVVANVALVAALVPTLTTREPAPGDFRIAHTSTSFVDLLRADIVDMHRAHRSGIGAYTHAKAITEIFAFELDRRMRARGLHAASIVTRPGIGVDARTPERAGVRDSTTPYRRNPFTPWAQGKDAAAWSAVRALIDPTLRGGELLSPANGRRGLPERVPAPRLTAAAGAADRLWLELEDLAKVRLSL
jgi:NAD(P)-dependent dehydrogenase (short-subunit alcohol dehydrogenase family)